MKVTSVEKYKGSTCCVVFDDESRIYVSTQIITEYNLKVGLTLTQNAVDDIVYDNDKRRARERALYIMSMKDHSFVELYNKLVKNYDENICLEICKSFAEKGIIDDERYAEKTAYQLFEVKKCGSYKVRQEMKLKGLSDEIIENELSKYEDSSDRLLSELVAKKYARYLTDEKGKRKVISALQRQGYSFSQIKAVLSEYDIDDEY